MTDTKGKSTGNVEYREAAKLKFEVEAVIDTSEETTSSRATTVTQFGNTIRLRIVPRSPRQSGNQAKTGE